MIEETDFQKIETLENIMNRGYYAQPREVTDLYNKVFGTRLSITSCSSCLRHRISLLVNEMRRAKAQLEKQVPEIEAEIETKEEKEVKDGTSKQRVERKKVNRKAASD